MDEFKIWALEDAASVVELESQRRMEAESLLEDTLVAYPDLLMPGLKLVGRQTPTAGGPLDLLGVDKYGRLSLFELKRGTHTRDAVAQVIDYAADLEAMDLAELIGRLAKESGERGIGEIEDFEEWYGQQFGEQELTSLRPLRMFLVGLGADERASEWWTSWPTTAAWTFRSSPSTVSHTGVRRSSPGRCMWKEQARSQTRAADT